jgi:rod shape determining protein RodA
MAPVFSNLKIKRGEMGFKEKFSQISWSLIFWLSVIVTIGIFMLYSAANASLDPWAIQQAGRFLVCLFMLVLIAMVDIRLIMQYAYIIYALVFALLIFVEFQGVVSGGAKRWIDLGPINIQPSELMKLGLILAVARYFHSINADEIGRPVLLLPPFLMLILPVILILRQPDLGTALMTIMGAGVIFFMAGVRLWKFIAIMLMGLITIPIVWPMLQDYQRERILIFLNPDRDPLGGGYHILQSQIALGSGGVFGKGFLQGTQGQLSFLPEQQTDFIFTMYAEELGFVGGIILIGLYAIVILYGFIIAIRCRNQFGRLLAIGITTTFFLYIFINIAMVMGLVPVVGVPLPLISYGGTALLTIMVSMGLLMSVHVHRDVQIGVRGGFDYE